MKLAKSRLKTNSQPKTRKSLPRKKISFGGINNYLELIPTLTMAMICYFLLWMMMRFIHPQLIQNWIFPNSFLPFHLIFGLGNFFLFSFLSRRKFWGFFFSVFFGWLVFLKLQKIDIDIWGVGSAIALTIGASFWWSLISFFSKKNNN
jgi:hypothetical protein